MNWPICDICLNSDILCSGCQDKIKTGKVKENEVKIARSLFDLSKKIKTLKEAELVKIIDSDIIVLVTKKGDGPKVVGKSGAIVKSLAKEFNKPIKVIEHENDMKEFAEGILKPAKISGMNKVYGKDGEEIKFRVSNKDKKRIRINSDSFCEMINSLYNCKTRLIFE